MMTVKTHLEIPGATLLRCYERIVEALLRTDGVLDAAADAGREVRPATMRAAPRER